MESYRAAEQSGQPVLPRSSLETCLAEAVNTLFDRSSSALPHFVPRGPAMRTSLLVTLIVFVIGLTAVLQDLRANSSSSNSVQKFRWVLMLGILLAVCSQLQHVVADKLYLIASLKLNHQHFANVWWLSKYMEALRKK